MNRKKAVMAYGCFFAMETSQSPGLPGILAIAYNSQMCLLALPVI
ncbi:hypothetical protein [Mediterraneibacter sp.]|nr:hypothetical protein [Mediterraneibacter sp.]